MKALCSSVTQCNSAADRSGPISVLCIAHQIQLMLRQVQALDLQPGLWLSQTELARFEMKFKWMGLITIICLFIHLQML
jgi:hypothetical protein